MAPTPEPPVHITIKVKVPPGYLSTTDNASGTDSFSLGSDIPVTSTVGHLRRNIQQLIPTHPPPERQRLLYGGRALVDNDQRLGDAFNVRRDPAQTEYVVHLLVKGEQGAGNGGSAHRRAVSTPPAQTQAQTPGQPGAPPQPQQGVQGQRIPMPAINAQLGPHQQPFPQIIARNQQMRAGMGMQGIGGQQAQGQAQPPASTNAESNGGQQTGQQPQQQGQNGAQAGATGQPRQGQQHPQIPGRPISGQGFHMQGVGPNGQRFQIHQQMMQFPAHGGAPGQGPYPLQGMPMLPGIIPHQGFPPSFHGHGQAPQQQLNGQSALDRARENMAEMRRVLEELRNQNNASEEQQRRIGEIQQRAESLNEYIDPLQMATNGGVNAQRPVAPNPAIPPTNRPLIPPPFQQGLPPLHNAPRRPTVPIPPHVQQQMHRPSNPSETTVYLLSSPQGPQALLLSPQHGAFTGSVANNARPQPTPTTQQQAQNDDGVPAAAHRVAQELQVQHAQLHAAAAANQGNQQAQEPDALGPVQGLLGHFWLLMRILIFAYFLLGSNMGWQRPLVLAVIGAGFWMVRAGVLGDAAAVRRWWDGLVGVERPPPAGEQAQRQEAQAAAQQPQQQQQGGRQAMPTPEQVAQRLLNEQADRNQQQNAWWRERLRPVERAVALFVASLWPGVGEATVRARREMEERQRNEEEVERNRREEEERARTEGAGAGGEEEEEGGSGEKGESSGVATAADGTGGEGLRERRVGAPVEEAGPAASSS